MGSNGAKPRVSSKVRYMNASNRKTWAGVGNKRRSDVLTALLRKTHVIRQKSEQKYLKGSDVDISTKNSQQILEHV